MYTPAKVTRGTGATETPAGNGGVKVASTPAAMASSLEQIKTQQLANQDCMCRRINCFACCFECYMYVFRLVFVIIYLVHLSFIRFKAVGSAVRTTIGGCSLKGRTANRHGQQRAGHFGSVVRLGECQSTKPGLSYQYVVICFCFYIYPQLFMCIQICVVFNFLALLASKLYHSYGLVN